MNARTEGIFITAARRSAIGKLGGALSGLSASEIGAQVCRGIIDGHGVDAAQIDEVIVGQVLQGGTGQNPGRQTAIRAGIPEHVPAMTINKVCGAGQKTIHLAAQAIKAGDASCVLCVGQDSMSRAPYVIDSLRFGQRMGNAAARDMMISDGLWDAFHDLHMGSTVEQLAKRFNISREDQDAFALASQQKAQAAIEAGAFAEEIQPVSVPTRKGEILFADDEHPRPITAGDLAAMRPAFAPDGTITAGNASGLNDGASAVLVCAESSLSKLGQTPLARIVSYASFALSPMDMGLAPAGAIRAALAKAGWQLADLDRVELNEAFAAQSLAVLQDLGLDPEVTNPDGGAIALGHPLAASGNRIVVSLIHGMIRSNARRGVAALCIGGGMGVALCLENTQMA